MEKNRKILFIIFILLLLALVGMYQNQQRKTLIIEAKQIVDAEKEKEKLLNAVNNPEITISSAIKSNGEFTFTLFTNLPDDSNVTGNIFYVKNNGEKEIVHKFNASINNKKALLEGQIDPSIFIKDNSARLQFEGNIYFENITSSFTSEIYDYTKYFIASEKIPVSDDNNNFQADIKTFNIPKAYILAEELSKTFGYSVESTTIDNDKITNLYKDNSYIVITGADISRILISGTFPQNSLDYGTITNILFSNNDFNLWTTDQIDKCQSGKNKFKSNYVNDSLNANFESYSSNFTITITPR